MTRWVWKVYCGTDGHKHSRKLLYDNAWDLKKNEIQKQRQYVKCCLIVYLIINKKWHLLIPHTLEFYCSELNPQFCLLLITRMSIGFCYCDQVTADTETVIAPQVVGTLVRHQQNHSIPCLAEDREIRAMNHLAGAVARPTMSTGKRNLYIAPSLFLKYAQPTPYFYK